jgi:hypothetical protein
MQWLADSLSIDGILGNCDLTQSIAGKTNYEEVACSGLLIPWDRQTFAAFLQRRI